MTTLAVGEVGAGTWGFLVIVALCVVTWLLIRNMSKRLKRLPESFTPDQGESGESASGPSAGA